MIIALDGASLTIADAARVARPDAQGTYAHAELAPAARERIAATRAHIKRDLDA